MNELVYVNVPCAVADVSWYRNIPDGHGVVYFIEINDKVKIGCTSKPAGRIQTIASYARKYFGAKIGRIAVSQPHSGYRESEAYLHKLFEAHRTPGTELFDIEFHKVTSKFLETAESIHKSSEFNKNPDALIKMFGEAQHRSIEEGIANKLLKILSDPCAYWCICNAPEVGKDAVFTSYLDVFIEEIAMSGEPAFESPDIFREKLLSLTSDIFNYFRICVQVDAIGDSGETGIRVMNVGFRDTEIQRELVKLIERFRAIKEVIV